MQVIITAKGIELTATIKEYADKKISALDKFYDQIIRAHVVLGVDNHHRMKGNIFVAECKLEVPGNDIFASQTAEDLYKSIDKVKDYLEKELKKHKVMMREKEKKAKRGIRELKEYRP